MRIERISNTQLKFVLMTDDLAERDIKINELSYTSDKTQQLFREIMTLVQHEQEFTEGETPLMFEAMRVGVDSLVVVVTKISSMAEQQFNINPAAKHECRFKRAEQINHSTASVNEDSFSIFSFDSLDLLASAVSSLPQNFLGASEVHKMDNRFFLVLTNETEDIRTTADLESILYEFGQKHASNRLSHQYLIDYGSPFLTENAVDKLRLYSDL